MPEGTTVAHLLEQLRDGGAHPVWSSLAVAVNREYAAASAVLHEGDEVALLPPVQEARMNGWRRWSRWSREPIDRDALVASLKQPADGAVVVFDGIVRDNTRGREDALSRLRGV